MRRVSMHRFALAALALLACRNGPVQGVDTDLGVEPASLDFGQVHMGGARSRAVTLTNRGRATLELTLSAPEPFAASLEQVALGAAESRSVEITFRPTATGAAAGQLEVQGLKVSLAGEGLEALACTASAECRTARFDAQAGACVDEP